MTRVFSWEPSMGAPPGQRPAVRVCADAVLELTAARQGLALTPELMIRRTAVFAWPTPEPPVPPSAAAADHPQALDVDPAMCAVARWDVLGDLLSPDGWRRLREHLVDLGVDDGVVEEELPVLAVPSMLMDVEQGIAGFGRTRADLLEEALAFFAADAQRYLSTWGPLAAAPESLRGPWEIVVPPGAILNAR